MNWYDKCISCFSLCNYDGNGLEADAVIHLKDGRYALVEVKFGRQEDIQLATC